MSNAQVLILLAVCAALLFGLMVFLAERERRLRDALQLRLAAPRAAAPANAVPVVFRKRQALCLLYVMAFQVLALHAWLNIGSPERIDEPVHWSVAAIEIGAALVALLFAWRQWRYRVVLADGAMHIGSLRTRTIRYEDIAGLEVVSGEDDTVCRIRLHDHAPVDVAHTLVGFAGFVERLSERVAAHARSR